MTTSRNLSNRGKDFVSVKDFGAVGDGVANDTAAIQAAINAAVAQNKAVYFPNGTYLISATLTLPNNVTLIGETQRKINSGANTYGVIIKTAANITMMQTTAVMPNFTYGIRIENISFWGNGSTGAALVIGDDAVNHLSFGITLRNIDIEYVGNGIKINGAAYITYIENISMAGTDLAGSYGLWFRRSQIAECHSVKIENFANCYFAQWSSHISLYDCSASFNVPGVANGNNLLRLYGAYHCNFYSCVFENLSTSSGSVVEVDIFEYVADPTKSTNNRFYNCAWNGIGVSACRVRIGSAVGVTTEKTFFENCTFRSWGTVTTTINFANSNGTTLVQCYEITGYDGANNTTPVTTGTDTALQIYDINGITFAGTSVVVPVTATYTATMTPETSGTITLNGSINSLRYVKNGKLVTVTGMLQVSSVSSPVGTYVSVSLPFSIANVGPYASRVGSSAVLSRAGAYSNLVLLGVENTSVVRLYTAVASIAASDQFSFSFSYISA